MIRKIKDYLNYLRLNTLSRIRKHRLSLTIDRTRTAHLNKQITCNHKWYGSNRGGFYINPGLLNERSVVYSFGIGKDITFDLACIRKHKCKVFGFDPTPKSINYIKSIKTNRSFSFYNYGISCVTGNQKFYFPLNPRGTSGSLITNESLDENKPINVLMKSFIDITDELGHKYIDVIKMDIEGAEYDVLESILNSDIAAGQILVEFHDRLFETGELRSKKTVKMMKQKGYEIFAISKSFEEVSFINKELLKNNNNI